MCHDTHDLDEQRTGKAAPRLRTAEAGSTPSLASVDSESRTGFRAQHRPGSGHAGKTKSSFVVTVAPPNRGGDNGVHEAAPPASKPVAVAAADK